jgi:formate--tetrahydrofolate ligase
MTASTQSRVLPASARPISDVAAEAGIGPELLEPYGQGVAKIRLEALDALPPDRKARYVVVSAITPTPLGEGKTVTTIGLGDGLRRIGRRAVISLRQGSMGPTFGIKGGAAGGGRSTLIPFDRVALHLTGDMHAVTAAHNLLSAMVDNHLFQGNALNLEPATISWRRVLDVNDRALRNVVIGLGAAQDGVPRQSGFDITAASEVMAVLALSTSLRDLRCRLGRIVVGHTRDGKAVTADDLHAAGAMTVLLLEAIKPNLVQTLESTPTIVHTGPFGNIAHGNSSVIGDLIGSRAGDYLVTEAGFGADMGAERFFDIKCRVSGLRPDAAVVVATVRALKAHSGKHRIVAGRSRTAGSSAFPWWWPSTPTPRITRQSTPPSAGSPRRWASAAPSTPATRTVARGRWRWPTRSSQPATRRAFSGCSTRTAPAWKRRWPRWRPGSMGPTASPTTVWPPSSFASASGTDSAASRSASPRPS